MEDVTHEAIQQAVKAIPRCKAWRRVVSMSQQVLMAVDDVVKERLNAFPRDDERRFYYKAFDVYCADPVLCNLARLRWLEMKSVRPRRGYDVDLLPAFERFVKVYEQAYQRLCAKNLEVQTQPASEDPEEGALEYTASGSSPLASSSSSCLAESPDSSARV
jgi:hypothetical protein